MSTDDKPQGMLEFVVYFLGGSEENYKKLIGTTESK
jgi:hypothetical protein